MPHIEEQNDVNRQGYLDWVNAESELLLVVDPAQIPVPVLRELTTPNAHGWIAAAVVSAPEDPEQDGTHVLTADTYGPLKIWAPEVPLHAESGDDDDLAYRLVRGAELQDTWDRWEVQEQETELRNVRQVQGFRDKKVAEYREQIEELEAKIAELEAVELLAPETLEDDPFAGYVAVAIPHK